MSLSIGFLEDPEAMRVPAVVVGVCAHVCVCVHISACIHLHTCMWRLEV